MYKRQAQLLAQSAVPEDYKFTKLIQSECKRIGNLVSKFEIFGDLGPLVKSNINIHDVIEKVKRSASQGYGSHVLFEENYDPSIPDVVGDFELLTQAMHNLIKNSCEAVSKKGGRINIKTSFYSGLALGSLEKRIKNFN